jgi:hypothetical protein
MLESLRSALSGRYTIECELGAGGMATVYSRTTSVAIATLAGRARANSRAGEQGDKSRTSALIG